MRAGVEIRAVADLRPTPARPPSALQAARRRGARRAHGRRGAGAQGRHRRRARASRAVATAAPRRSSAPSSATWWSSPAARARPARCCCRPAPRRAYDEALRALRGHRLPGRRGPRAGEVAGLGRRRRRRATPASCAGLDAAHALELGDAESTRARPTSFAQRLDERPAAPTSRSPRPRSAASAASASPACARTSPQGHQAQHRRGLRLDRALQALHDRDDGPVPGPHVPAARDPA